MPTLPDDYYPDPDALYEERHEWHDHWYADIDRDCGNYDLYEDEEDDQ